MVAKRSDDVEDHGNASPDPDIPPEVDINRHASPASENPPWPHYKCEDKVGQTQIARADGGLSEPTHLRH